MTSCPRGVPHPRHRATYRVATEPARSEQLGTREALSGPPRATDGNARRKGANGTSEYLLRVCNTRNLRSARGTRGARATNEEASTGGRRCSSRDPTNPYKPIATHAPSRTKRTRSQVRCRPPSRPMKTFEQSTTNERTRTPPLRHEKNLSDPTCTPDVKHIRAMMFAFLVSLN